MNITIVGDGWVALPVMKMRRVRVGPGTTVSLIPFGDCSGITLSGLQYPLKNARMRVGEIGVSNVVVKSPCTVSVRKGNMLMMLHAGYFSCTVLA
jgi:thiamine pyrophosphokinase